MAQSHANKSIKHDIISKDNSRILITISVAVFIVVFSAFAAKALIDQSMYHQRVIAKKEEALKVLKANKQAADELKVSYQSFATESINVLSGNPTGTGPLDGDNAKIVLDSLPSVYDFPALSSSIEKILLDGGYQIEGIGGVEDPTLSTTADATVTTESAPVEIPYPFSVKASPDQAAALFQTLERSIRPFTVRNVVVEGNESILTLTINLSTYFQPSRGLEVTTEVVQ